MQPALHHSSAESEIISLDSGLRMDGLPALQFGECVLGTLASLPAAGNCGHQQVDQDIDFVTADISDSAHLTQLHLFEDNAAVIHMITKGRSPTSRHVTRTQTVNLDLLFERINLNNFSIKLVRPADQLAHLLTDGPLSSQQWQSLLHLWRIENVSHDIAPVE